MKNWWLLGIIFILLVMLLRDSALANSTASSVWNTNRTFPKLYNYNESCVLEKAGSTIVPVGSTTGYDNITVYKDPCDAPHKRRFMHCTPIATGVNVCRCYRFWDYPSSVPNYTDKGSFESAPEWMDYDKDSKECLIRTGKKCGLSAEVSPYRCHSGRCIEMKGDDRFSLYCSSGSLVVPQFITISITTVLITFSTVL